MSTRVGCGLYKDLHMSLLRQGEAPVELNAWVANQAEPRDDRSGARRDLFQLLTSPRLMTRGAWGVRSTWARSQPEKKIWRELYALGRKLSRYVSTSVFGLASGRLLSPTAVAFQMSDHTR